MRYPGRTRSAEGYRRSHPVVARASSGSAGHGQSRASGNPADLQLELASPVVIAFVLQGDGRACPCTLRITTMDRSRPELSVLREADSQGPSNEKKCSPLWWMR